MIYEFQCTRCKETFLGDNENDTEHAIRENGDPCYSKGILLAIYGKGANGGYVSPYDKQ